MSARMRLTMTSTMVFFVLIFSAIITVPALADDSAPPPPDTPVVTQPGDDGSTQPAALDPSSQPADVPAAAPAPVDDSSTQPTTTDQTSSTSPSDPAPDPTKEAEVASTQDASSTTEILAQIPDGTAVVVLDQSGEAIPLATQEAANTIISGDPVWCPSTVAVPTPGMGGCTITYTTFMGVGGLLSDLIFTAGGPAMNGTIWIASNYAGADSSAITLNGTTYSTMKNFTLTLKGGWCDGTDVTCAGLIDTTKPSAFDVPINILNWSNDVTLSDLVISGANAASSLEVSTTKNITLTNVKANNNPNAAGRGAYLHNDIASGTGNVTVTNSVFNGNHSDGLYVTSKGTITLAGVTANSNTNGYGAHLDNQTVVVAKAVTLTGTNTFNNNGTATGNDGLFITSFGQITLNNVTASNNGSGAFGSGANLYNDIASSTGGVTLTGMNIFTDNHSTGLYIASRGAVNLNSVYSNSNSNLGAVINNSNAVTAQPVKLTGTSEFKYNTSIGLSITSKGLISLNNLTVNWNGGAGAGLTNTSAFAAGIALSGTNTFSNNFNGGLNITTNGAVTMNNITANKNGLGVGGRGVQVTNNGIVNFNGVTFTGMNSFNGNQNDGLYITSSGAVVLNNITANSAVVGTGAFIDNSSSGAGVPKSVTLLGVNTFNSNSAVGLEISSYGAIAVSNVTANSNVSYGAYISNLGSTLPQSVTLNGTNTFNSNQNTGLVLQSKGAILTNNITASNNTVGMGASISNTTGTSASSITMTGVNVFNFNQSDNLEVYSAGTMNLSSITANGSIAGMGADIGNTGATSAPVTLSGTNTFNSNFARGVRIASNGLITANNITANQNTSGAGSSSATAGAFLINFTSPAKAGVKITGFGTFNGNNNPGAALCDSLGSCGLLIWTLGPVTATNLTANSNTSDGVNVDMSLAPSAVGGVSLLGTNSFSGNSGTNLYIDAFGAITLNNITATGSTLGRGAWINNKQTANQTAPKTVTLTGMNIFSGNNSYGLTLTSYGSVVASGLTANSNGQIGVDINNVNPQFPTPILIAATVTLNGPNNFSLNISDNLRVTTQGLITTNNITSNGTSGGYGAELINNGGTTAGVTMNGVNTFLNDKLGGFTIVTNGVILANSITASGSNAGAGAQFDNTGSTSTAPRSVTLNGVNVFNNNAATGLTVLSFGAIKINNVTANDNGTGGIGKGAFLDNFSGAVTASNVTLTGVNTFNQNQDQGIYIHSLGSIAAADLTANLSIASYGAQLNNSGAPSNASGVTLTGTNTFTANQATGLQIDTQGAVTLNGISATGSIASLGVSINNQYTSPTSPKPVTLTGTNNFSGNQTGGLYITSYGNVSANNVTASNTAAGWGVNINNVGGTPQGNVIFTGTNTFSSNVAGGGLAVTSDGAVTLNSLTANSNSLAGVAVTNTAGTGAVSLTGLNAFNGNGQVGLSISSNGAVSLTRVSAELNTQSGMTVTTTSAVTLTCGDFKKNGLYGWEAHSAPTITMIGVFSSLNNTSGPYTITGGGTLTTVHDCPLP